MKKVLIMFLLGITTVFSQTTIVKGVTLSYSKKDKVMTLSIPENAFNYPQHSDLEKEIKIRRNFEMTMTINGQEYSVSDPYTNYFIISGHKYPMSSAHYYIKNSNCKIIKEYRTYKFYDVEPGEFILVVSEKCDDKYLVWKETGSIVIQ